MVENVLNPSLSNKMYPSSSIFDENRFIDINIDSDNDEPKKQPLQQQKQQKNKKPKKCLAAMTTKTTTTTSTTTPLTTAHLFNINKSTKPSFATRKPTKPATSAARKPFDILLSNLNDVGLYSGDDDDDDEEEEHEDEEKAEADKHARVLDLSYDFSRKDPIFNSSTLSSSNRHNESMISSNYDLSILGGGEAPSVDVERNHSTPLASNSINSIEHFAHRAQQYSIETSPMSSSRTADHLNNAFSQPAKRRPKLMKSSSVQAYR